MFQALSRGTETHGHNVLPYTKFCKDFTLKYWLKWKSVWLTTCGIYTNVPRIEVTRKYRMDKKYNLKTTKREWLWGFCNSHCCTKYSSVLVDMVVLNPFDSLQREIYSVLWCKNSNCIHKSILVFVRINIELDLCFLEMWLELDCYTCRCYWILSCDKIDHIFQYFVESISGSGTVIPGFSAQAFNFGWKHPNLKGNFWRLC